MVNFSAYIFTPDGMKASDNKIGAVRDWPEKSKTKEEIKSSLGFARFVQDFAYIAGKVNQLIKQQSVLDWSERQGRSFQRLEAALCFSPILAFAILQSYHKYKMFWTNWLDISVEF